jgi:hypothetical protein
VTHNSFQFRVDQGKLTAAELQDGHYLLRSNLVSEDPAVLWERYVQLAQIEAAFKTMKSELGIRPLYHRLGHRVEAHILVAFLAYCLLITLKRPWLPPRDSNPDMLIQRQHGSAFAHIDFVTFTGKLLVRTFVPANPAVVSHPCSFQRLKKLR